MYMRTSKRLTAGLLCVAFLLLSGCAGQSNAAAIRRTSTPPRVVAAVIDRSAAATSTPSATPQPRATPTAESTPASPTGAGTVSASRQAGASTITFAVIGDDGTHSEGEKAVAEMVNGWNPDFILDTGDAYYARAGGYTTDKYDRSVGTYYCDFLKDVTTTGTDCPHGSATRNRFFPTLGNHDYTDASLDNYLKYFDLPGSGFKSSSGNERYYDFTWGPVHFFAINSNQVEPDGTSPDSKQGQWLKKALAASTSAWNIVFFHHPPYSSGATHGDGEWMQWPFKDWGVTAVLSGHEHLYERLQKDGVIYFVNGAGGGDHYDFRATPEAASRARVAGVYGAQKITATDKTIRFEFYAVDGKRADSYTIHK